MTTEFQYDVFLSHNQADKPRVRRLAERLRAAGLRVWFDEWVIKPGDDIYLAIERGLDASRTLLLCLSPAALGSDWVGLERSTVLFRDPSNAGRRFIPLLLADCKLPDTLRRYRHVDYREEARAAFEQLLAGCRPQNQTTPVSLTSPFFQGSSQLLLQEQEEQWRRDNEGGSKMLPPGLKLVRKLEGLGGTVFSLAFHPSGLELAAGDSNKKVTIWEVSSGKLMRSLEGHTSSVFAVAYDAIGHKLASGSNDRTVKVWDATSGRLISTFEGAMASIRSVAMHPQGLAVAAATDYRTVEVWDTVKGALAFKLERTARVVAFDPTGRVLASGSADGGFVLCDSFNGKLVGRIQGHRGEIQSIAFDAAGTVVASGGGSQDGAVMLWAIPTGRLLRTLEGHSAAVQAIVFSGDQQLMASRDERGLVCVWECNTWELLFRIQEKVVPMQWAPSVAFHPNLPLLATHGFGDGSNWSPSVHLWEYDLARLRRSQFVAPSIHYVNAKVVLVGDTGVGKTGLSFVLNARPFEATDSTPGRRVEIFDTHEVALSNNRKQTRETLLWDLAGQPGYRIIHQLHLNEVAVALLVFDARSETDPLAGVRHWERALRLARQRQGSGGVPMKKFLVSARNDRGGVSVSKERVQSMLMEFGFDGYFETSAKEGWQIKELKKAVEQGIAWEELPVVTSSELFVGIKSFLVEMKKTERLLVQASHLYDEFARQHRETAAEVAELRDQFNICIGRLENRDLIRRLTFGGYVLLQPELLDAYGSAMVNTAKEEPDGLGSLAEEIALAGKFFVPKEQKVTDPGQEQLLLHATVEELVRHDLALRENADDGRYLVFPSQFNRDYEDAPEPKGKAVAVTFDGPVQSLYSTLAVRLGHSGLFTTGRAEMWRNAAVFTARAGGKCGLFVHEFAEGRGRLILFFPDEHSSAETRFHFEEFVLAHAKRRALDGTVELVRFFVCPDCGDPVPDSYVKRLREKGKMEFNCPCGGTVSLAEPKERIHFRSKVEAMDKSADGQRDFDAFVMSAKGETSTKSFQDWAGGEQVTLASKRSRDEKLDIFRKKIPMDRSKPLIPKNSASRSWNVRMPS